MRKDQIELRYDIIIDQLYGNFPEAIAGLTEGQLKRATVSKLAQKLGVTRTTIYNDMKNPEFHQRRKERLREIYNPTISNVAYRHIVKAVLDGDLNVCKWLLEQLDFFEKKQTDPLINVNILTPQVCVDGVTPEQGRQLLHALNQVRNSQSQSTNGDEAVSANGGKGNHKHLEPDSGGQD